ncbi:helicase-related protein [Candidatus Thioglobus sp.]|nr:helicase-related protein [Candidatus Thioglobus sp.]
MSEQKKVLHYLGKQLIGPRNDEKEFIESVNPSDLYLLGRLHPIEVNDELPIDDNEKIEGYFQSKPPSFGLSFYIENGNDFNFSISFAKYSKSKIIDLEVLKLMTFRAHDLKPKNQELADELDNIFKLFSNDETLIPDQKLIKRLNEIYILLDKKIPNEKIIKNGWQRKPFLHEQGISKPVDSSSSDFYLFDELVRVNIIWRPFNNGFITTISMINNLKKEPKKFVENQLYQSKIKVSIISASILPYPVKTELSYDEEEEELSLRYRKNKTFVIGHSCAASYQLNNNKVESLSSEFLPFSIVKPVTLELENNSKDSTLNLQFLCGKNLSAEELKKSLTIFVNNYEKWLTNQQKIDTSDKYFEARDRILNRIQNSISRMRLGIKTITDNSKVFESFKLANLSMLMQMVHASDFSNNIKDKDEKPFDLPNYYDSSYNKYNWRPFQLAFVLLTIESVVNEKSEHRNVVDLIWFPTGGGKTEAYLAVSAFEMFYRRMKYGDAGAGTVVIKRYPLRLLSAQQFQRASILICACELLRQQNTAELGLSPFSIGLWVGQATSPNSFSNVERSDGAFELYKKTLTEEHPENRFVVQKCPWCGTRIIPSFSNEESHYGIKASTSSFSFNCPSVSCQFHDKLPLSVVDDDLYMNPPSFIIATVDKFARLAWTDRPKVFFGIGSKVNPPSLIIQDEMHLISGPIGTISGLYEAAIDQVISSTGGASPKMIAATATIRRADEQIRRLYAAKSNIFPSSGINEYDSYFARTDNKAEGRMYIGAMGQSDTQITAMIQVSSVLAQLPEAIELSDVAKDAYWTQIVYHNSMKELAKTINTASDDIPNRLEIIYPNTKRRKLKNIAELSSNIKGGDLSSILERMGNTIHDNNNDTIDMLPSTNMISVGVDVPRVGLMLMNGQPKTTSEYIQASSRVGRGEVPGIVVTVYPAANPRARSHYESFIPYHESLYKFVEPTSVTPYAEPARDRALHAALVILMRYAGGIGDNEQACLFDLENPQMKKLIEQLVTRMQKADSSEKNSIAEQMNDKAKEWQSLKVKYPYLRYDGKGNQFKTLLVSYEERSKPSNAEKWATLNSVRNVDVEVAIKVWGESS